MNEIINKLTRENDIIISEKLDINASINIIFEGLKMHYSIVSI